MSCQHFREIFPQAKITTFTLLEEGYRRKTSKDDRKLFIVDIDMIAVYQHMCMYSSFFPAMLKPCLAVVVMDLYTWNKLFFSSPEPKAQVSYCHSALSVVRLSVRRRPLTFTFSTDSPEPLDGFWWNLVGMKYSWPLTSVVVFRPDPPRGGSRGGGPK